MKPLRIFAITAIVCASLLTLGLHLLGQQDEEARRAEKKKEREEYLKKYPLPKTSIKLKRVASFPTEEQIGNDIYLRGVWGISIDGNGDIYVCDNIDNKIMVFDSTFKFLRQIGSAGQGPGTFNRPFNAIIWKDMLVVNDSGNLRIQFLDKTGKYLKGFRTYRSYYDMKIRSDGVFYFLRALKYKEPYIADALTQDGKLLFSFVDSFTETPNISVLNMGNLSCDKMGQVYMMSWYTNIIRKYSVNGKLLQEIELKYPVMKDYLENNKKFYSSTERRLRFKNCAHDIWLEDEKLIIARYSFARLEFIEFDMKGNLKNVFWTDEFPDGYGLQDFLVKKDKGKYLFYVAKVYPETVIDVFSY